jgi:hypothetical protein
MILHVSFEEVSALNSAAQRLLGPSSGGGVVAPPEALAELESRLPVSGDVSVETLAEQTRLLGALDFVLTHLKRRMDAVVLEQYVGSDDAVNAYFDYANVLTIRTRLEAIGREMAALIELMTGKAPSGEAAQRISFS